MPNFLSDMVLDKKADKLKFNNTHFFVGGGHVAISGLNGKKPLHTGYFSFVLNWPLFKKHCSPQWPIGQEFADQLESSPQFSGNPLTHLKELTLWKVHLHINALITKMFYLLIQ